MDRAASYLDDIYAWSREQAAALRRLAETRRDLPSELDLQHVAEEIEHVGKTEIRAVESFLELLLRNILKVASAPESRAVRHWGGEMRIQHRSLVREFRDSMRQIVDLDGAWRASKIRADAALDEDGQALIPDLPEDCPFALDELAARDFDPEPQLRWLLTRRRPSASGSD